jgi:hypothetical protein
MTWFRTDLIKEHQFINNTEEYTGVISLIEIPDETVLGCFDGETFVFEVDENNTIIPSIDVDIETCLHIYRYDNKVVVLGSYENHNYSGIDYINHSCNPNCYINNGILIKTNRLINEGEELTFDYRISNLALEGNSCWCNVENKCKF